MTDRAYQEKMIREMLSEVVPSADETAAGKLLRYYEMLIERNQVMNLTAITDFHDVVEKHFADSLLIVQATDLSRVSSMIDVGTGAGFPGIPLKIVFPQMKVTLLDSLHKRIGFLNDVIRELELREIEAVHGRAEDFGKDPDYRESYDLCVSRAVANLSVLSELCLPFVKQSGWFISYKTAGAGSEIDAAENAVSKLGGGTPERKMFPLPGTDQIRLFVCIPKTEKTPQKYPRKAGIPAKRPL